MRRIYLDYAATTPTDKRVVDAMTPYFTEIYGNASSIHGYGREAKAALEDNRTKLANLTGARDSEFFFTSGGTESDNSALFGIASKFSSSTKKHLIISSIEHHAVFHAAESLRKNGFDVTLLPVDSKGLVSPDDLKQVITNETFLISIIHANNEIGTIQNLPELVKAAHDKGILIHTDAVQSFCKTKFDVKDSGVDLVSFAAHKIYGPKGIGALYIKRGIDFQPILYGGSQERNRRPGTESIPLVAGFTKAAELCAEEFESERIRLLKLNGLLRTQISTNVSGALFNSSEENSVPNILSVSIDSNQVEIDGEALIINMDLKELQ